MAELLTRAQAEALCERILARRSVDGMLVSVQSRRVSHTRYAASAVTASADADTLDATVTARVGRREASVSFVPRDDDAITAAVRRAEATARLAPEDPEQMSLLGPQTYAEPPAFVETTAALAASDRAAAVRAVMTRVADDSLEAAGYLATLAEANAVANSSGLFAYHRATLAAHTLTVRTADGSGSGWAGTTHNDWARLVAPDELAARAAEKARASRGAAAIAPGAYTVVLEPTAVGNLLQRLPAHLDARAADEGRSMFAAAGGGTKLGTRVADPRVTVLSDPTDPDLLAQPFTDEGLPIGRTAWIERGVLRTLASGRYWAARQGRAPAPVGGGLKLAGGSGTAADLVGTIERGLLVTRFWYIRGVDPRAARYTGLTRDGVFRIEGGEVAGAVKNLRFNESVVAMLANVEALGAPVRVAASESAGLGSAVAVPPLVARDFQFTSVSDAV